MLPICHNVLFNQVFNQVFNGETVEKGKNANAEWRMMRNLP